MEIIHACLFVARWSVFQRYIFGVYLSRLHLLLRDSEYLIVCEFILIY